MTNKNKILLAVSLLACPLSAVTAQTTSIPVGQQGRELQGIERPNRYMTETEVETRFGDPVMKSTPVGEPAIKYWEYDNYYVYFENDRVLHTVLRKE